MNMEKLVATIYNIQDQTAASAMLAGYKALQNPAARAASGAIDLEELDTVIGYLITARERFGGVAGSDGRPCPAHSAPADGSIRCLRLDGHGGDHWFVMGWDGTTPERPTGITVAIDDQEAGDHNGTPGWWTAAGLASAAFRDVYLGAHSQDGQTTVTEDFARREGHGRLVARSNGTVHEIPRALGGIVLPTWEAMPDYDRGQALKYLDAAETEDRAYAMEHYPVNYRDHEVLAALPLEAAHEHAESLFEDGIATAVEELGLEEVDRLIDLTTERLDPAREAEQDMIQRGEEPVDGDDYR